MASLTAPTKVTLEPHDAGDHNLRQAMRRISIFVAAFALVFFALGVACGKGGVTGLVIEGIVVVGCLAFPLLEGAPWANPDSWLRGLFGEAMVAHLLGMLPATFHCWHDVTVTSHGRRSNIDHLVVGPTGIWAIETKNWKGEFQKSGSALFHNGRDRSDLIR
jgi:hypothetical protein